MPPVPGPARSSWAARSFGLKSRRGANSEMLAMPPSLWPADPSFLLEWADGRFALAGVSIELDGRSPFEVREAPQAWLDALNGFGWLRHVPATASPTVTEQIEALVVDWLKTTTARSGPAGGDAVVARRAVSWLAHADVILHTARMPLYDGVLTALLADVRTLDKRWRTMDQPATRLLALIAITEASLCLSGAAQMQRDAEAALAHELSERRAPALTGLLRNPDALAGLILDLESLRLLYRMRLMDVPPFLKQGMARLTRTLAGIRLGDGTAARLGSARRNAEERLTLAAVQRHVDLPAIASLQDGAAGYVRLLAGETCAVLDTGAPFGSRSALELEISSGTASLFVHDGREPSSPGQATIMLQPDPDAGATGVEPVSPLPITQATHNATVEIADEATQRVDATHAGLARFGFVHRRQVKMDEGGRRVFGIDELRPIVGHSVADGQSLSARFVLHPGVVAALAETPDRVDLTLPNGHRWQLSAAGQIISVEGALYRDGLRTSPTVQLTISPSAATAGKGRSVTWLLRRLDLS